MRHDARVTSASPEPDRQGGSRAWVSLVFTHPNRVFITAALAYLLIAAVFLLLTFAGTSNPRLAVVFTVCSTVLPWVAGQSFKKEAHAREIAALQGQQKKETLALKRQQKMSSKTDDDHRGKLKTQERAAWASHASMSVRKVFRSSTAFLDIRTMSESAIAEIGQMEDSSVIPRRVSEALGRVREVSKREAEAAPDMVAAWREVSPEEVDKAVAELEQVQRRMD